MNRLILATLTLSILSHYPAHASSIMHEFERTENQGQLLEKFLFSNGTFDAQKARHFLFQLKREIQERYQMELDLHLVIEEAIKTISRTGNFFENDAETARIFYSQLLADKIHTANLFGLGQKKSKHKHTHQQELILPDKMAMGFMCILGGAILSIIPFGLTQGVGTSLIGTGIYAIIDGVREGERPYYLDPQTGEKTSIEIPRS